MIDRLNRTEGGSSDVRFSREDLLHFWKKSHGTVRQLGSRMNRAAKLLAKLAVVILGVLSITVIACGGTADAPEDTAVPKTQQGGATQEVYELSREVFPVELYKSHSLFQIEWRLRIQ